MFEAKSKRSCNDMWDVLSSVSDGDASPEELRTADEHVASCPACARDLEFILSAATAARGRAVDPPLGLRERILCAALQRSGLREVCLGSLRFGMRPRRVALCGAAASILLALIFAKSSPPSDRTSLRAAPPQTARTVNSDSEPFARRGAQRDRTRLARTIPIPVPVAPDDRALSHKPGPILGTTVV